MAAHSIEPLVDQLATLEVALHDRDFLLTWNHPVSELRAVLLAAEVLRQMHQANVSTRLFDGGLAVSNFRDQSTRTRFSFASAASMVGLALQELDEAKSQIAHGETVRETATMISFLAEVIGIRDDIYLGEGHKYMCQVAEALDQGYRDRVLPQRPAVINLQCDQDHPTQSLSDLLHLQHTFGSLEALRGRKLAMTWAYSPSYGKPLSVPQGIINLMTRFGMHVVLAHPRGYDLIPAHLDLAAGYASESGGSFQVAGNMFEAFQGADIVYPKSWAPFDVMQERTVLLKEGNRSGLADLERRCLERNARHRDWECTSDHMGATRQGSALYMHCLPADISGVSCAAGEVAADVFERYRVATYRQASYKPFIIAAMILLTRLAQPAEALRGVLARNQPRRLQG